MVGLQVISDCSLHDHYITINMQKRKQDRQTDRQTQQQQQKKNIPNLIESIIARLREQKFRKIFHDSYGSTRLLGANDLQRDALLLITSKLLIAK